MVKFFSVDSDSFKVTIDGQWIALWTGETWHVNPFHAWSKNVQGAANTVLESN